VHGAALDALSNMMDGLLTSEAFDERMDTHRKAQDATFRSWARQQNERHNVVVNHLRRQYEGTILDLKGDKEKLSQSLKGRTNDETVAFLQGQLRESRKQARALDNRLYVKECELRAVEDTHKKTIDKLYAALGSEFAIV
jgi:hypothetical protein